MKNTLLISSVLLLSACVSTPDRVSFNGKYVGTYSPSAGCGTLMLTEDCSGLSGAKRAIEIGGVPLRIAGGEGGEIVFVMSKPTFTPDEAALKSGAKAIEELMEVKGVEVLSTKVMYGNGLTFGIHYTFKSDGYSHLKELSI